MKKVDIAARKFHSELIFILQCTVKVVVDLRSSYLQDVSQDKIPIMLVGNKTDLRQQALDDGVQCISTSYGEKLARVRAFTMIYIDSLEIII